MVLVYFTNAAVYQVPVEGYEIGGIIRIGCRTNTSLFTDLTGTWAADWQRCGCAWCNCHFGLLLTDPALLLLQIKLQTLVHFLSKGIDPTSPLSQSQLQHLQHSFSREM